MKRETVLALKMLRDTRCTAYRAAKTAGICLPTIYRALKRLGLPTDRSTWLASDIAKLGELSHVDKLRGEL